MKTLLAPSKDFAAPCQDFPDKIALSLVTLSGAERWSYAKLLAEVGHVAAEMLVQQNEDRSLTLSPQSPLEMPLHFAASLRAGLTAQWTRADGQKVDATSAAPLALPIEASDRLFLIGELDDPLSLSLIMSALGQGVTVLCPSPKLTLAQLPILMRRHDVSVIAGCGEALNALLAANLTALPKLKASFALDHVTEALQETWLARMGQPLSQI